MSTVDGVRLVLHQFCECQLVTRWKRWHFVSRPPLLASTEPLARLLSYFLAVHYGCMVPRGTWTELAEYLVTSGAREMRCAEPTEWYTLWYPSNHSQTWANSPKSMMLSSVPRDCVTGVAVSSSGCLVGGARQNNSHKVYPLAIVWKGNTAKRMGFVPLLVIRVIETWKCIRNSVIVGEYGDWALSTMLTAHDDGRRKQRQRLSANCSRTEDSIWLWYTQATRNTSKRK